MTHTPLPPAFVSDSEGRGVYSMAQGAYTMGQLFREQDRIPGLRLDTVYRYLLLPLRVLAAPGAIHPLRSRCLADAWHTAHLPHDNITITQLEYI
jgi:hypothetical protein